MRLLLYNGQRDCRALQHLTYTYVSVGEGVHSNEAIAYRGFTRRTSSYLPTAGDSILMEIRRFNLRYGYTSGCFLSSLQVHV